jgi:D-alanyl-D-alanine carboxypeptidase/D-alanyl-D-alanine-endopeptidase (penicillin-binding protein 4)
MHAGFGQWIGDSLRVPSRGLRQIATILVVLAVAAATGGAVALSAPALVADLGLVRPQPTATVAQRVPALGALPVDAPMPSEAGLAAVLDPLAKARGLGTFSAVVLDPASGRALWQRDPGRALVPGSAAKLLTGAAALLTLSQTDRLVTRVVTGAEPGTVVLIGGGDPTLTAAPKGTDTVYPSPARLTDLAEQVRAAAPGPVTRVLVDTTRYFGPALAPSWSSADVTAGFVAPIEPLMLDGGRTDATLQDGPRTREPALAAGRAFASLLGADVDAVAEETAPAQAEVLGSVSSPMVSELVEHMTRTSDNVLAEVLAREVALARGGPPTFEGGVQQVLAALGQAGFDTTGTVLLDGSGLTRSARVPAQLLGAVLAEAAAPVHGEESAPFLRPIVSGLPVAGGDGTLDERFEPESPTAAGRGVVRAKTGTLSGASSLAGVVTDADGRLLVFALMSNGASPVQARPRLDAIAAQLSRCGCT